MKKAKKITIIILSLMLAAALTVPAFADTADADTAAGEGTGKEAAETTVSEPDKSVAKEACTEEEAAGAGEDVIKEDTETGTLEFYTDDYNGPEGLKAAVEGTINPEYKDEYGIRPYTNANTGLLWDTCDDAYLEFLDGIRGEMKDREEVVEAYYVTDATGLTNSYARNFAATAMSDIFVHTGIADEGDYLYWTLEKITANYMVRAYGDGSRFTVTFTFVWRETADEEEQVTQEVKNILNSFGWDEETTDYEKAVDIYDHICSTVTYDKYTLLWEEMTGQLYGPIRSAYGALCNHSAVCHGIALSVYRLMLESGIDCRFIYGMGQNDSHAWNIIELDGVYYNIDATWDLGNEPDAYSWFLLCDDEFNTLHTRGGEYAATEFYAAYPVSEVDYVKEVKNEDIGDITVEYDDYIALSDLFEWADPKTDYVICDTEDINITSYQVKNGSKTSAQDTDLVVMDDGKTLHAAGVGAGTVYFTEKDAYEAGDTSNVYEANITVEEAPLTLMFLTGQSNMEGYCDAATGYNFNAAVACDKGTVYSTYAPSTANNGKNISEISSISACTASTAGSFVAGSLTGTTDMNGKTLAYKPNALTTAGTGKTGMDSGIAYEWNKETGDKVWVINTGYGATSINKWVPGGTCNTISTAVWKDVLKTYAAETDNHYTAKEKLVFWLQGESDKSMSASDYESYFDKMYTSMDSQLGFDAFGVISVRSSTGSYTTSDELYMTGPRIAQYYLGCSSAYDNVFVVSNANEQWISDSGVSSYFKSAYPGGKLSYPTRGGTDTLPTKMTQIHSDIHYSQIAHNENGITAASGMAKALAGTKATGISWRDATGKKVTSLTVDYTGDAATLVAVTDPVYASSDITFKTSTGVTYNASKGTVTASKEGTSTVTAYANGKQIGQINVNCVAYTDLSNIFGKVNGVYKYNGIWYYLLNGIVQKNYTGVADYKNDNGWWYIKNGKVDFDYTGFAANKNGKWYVENGKVTFEKKGILKDTQGGIGSTSDWYYVIGSKVQESFTGLSEFSNSNGWWYIKKGKVDFAHNGVDKNQNGWYYLTGGKVQFGFTGLGDYGNSNGWWYIKGGKVDFSHKGIDKNKNGWWYVIDGKVQFGYTGVGDFSNSNGWWYIKDGKVDFSTNTVAKNKNGWWYVEDGKVNFGFTGLANYKNENGWWYIKGGKVDFTRNSVDKNKNGWWVVRGGKVDFGFTGFASNRNGTWYCKNGKVQFDANGTVTAGGQTRTVNGGKVV